MAIVSVDELRRYMSDVNLTDRQWENTQDVIVGVHSELEQELGRPIELVQVRERVPADEGGYARLSVTPVVQILSVDYNGNYTQPTVVDKQPLSDSDVTRVMDSSPFQNNIVAGGIYTGKPNTFALVEYIGGYNGLQDMGLKRKIMEVAARIVTYQHDDSISLKDGIANNPDSRVTPRGWTQDDFFSLRRLKRPTIV